MVKSRNGVRVFALLATLLATLTTSCVVGQARAGTFAATSVRTDAAIAVEGEYLSGRSLTVVCARTEQDWTQALTAVGLPSAQADKYYGFSLISQGVMHLSPYVCDGLRFGTVASMRASHPFQVAWSVDVLVHESVHMGRFSSDEALAEACARVSLPVELHRLYGLAYHSAEMSRLTLAAAWFRGTQPAAYHGGTCTPVA